MRVGQRVAQGHADQHDIAVRQRALVEQLVERVAADELGDEVDRPVVAAGLEQRDDRRVRQAGGGQRLLLGPRGGGAAGDRDPLDGDEALEALVARQPDRAEPARAELLEQRVAVEDQGAGGGSVVLGGLHLGSIFAVSGTRSCAHGRDSGQ